MAHTGVAQRYLWLFHAVIRTAVGNKPAGVLIEEINNLLRKSAIRVRVSEANKPN